MYTHTQNMILKCSKESGNYLYNGKANKQIATANHDWMNYLNIISKYVSIWVMAWRSCGQVNDSWKHDQIALTLAATSHADPTS